MAYALDMKKNIAALLLSLLVLSSCQVTENLELASDGTGNSVTEIHVEDFFITVLSDFSEFLPESDTSIMDGAIDGYIKSLENASAVSNPEWESLGDNNYKVEFSFASIASLLSDMGAENQSIFTLTDNSIAFSLDINNYPELKSIVPFLADPNFEVYGPEYNQGMSEADYLDMIYFLLGEEGPEAVTNGTVEVLLTVPGTITETKGCTAINGNTASFEFPIIDFLLLNTPLSFSIVWQ